MCDIESLMGSNQVQHWFDNEEREFIISAMKNREDMAQENNTSNQIWSSFFNVSRIANKLLEILHVKFLMNNQGIIISWSSCIALIRT